MRSVLLSSRYRQRDRAEMTAAASPPTKLLQLPRLNTKEQPPLRLNTGTQEAARQTNTSQTPNISREQIIRGRRQKRRKVETEGAVERAGLSTAALQDASLTEAPTVLRAPHSRDPAAHKISQHACASHRYHEAPGCGAGGAGGRRRDSRRSGSRQTQIFSFSAAAGVFIKVQSSADGGFLVCVSAVNAFTQRRPCSYL